MFICQVFITLKHENLKQENTGYANKEAIIVECENNSFAAFEDSESSWPQVFNTNEASLGGPEDAGEIIKSLWERKTTLVYVRLQSSEMIFFYLYNDLLTSF